ncbi:MAG: TVP38/TMEM64 family protein [Leucobacter sp.]
MSEIPPQSGHTDPETEPPVVRGAHWGSWLRNTALLVVLLGMLWLVFNVDLPSIDQLRSVSESWGGLAWVVFILFYAIVAITPIPVTIMAVAGGVLFGVIEGSILSVVGALLGSWAAYWLARGLGKETVHKLLGKYADTVEGKLEKSGAESVYLLRVMPGIPYWPVNYGSGAFGISQRDFLVGSGISTIPGQVSLVAVGAFIADPSIFSGVIVVAAWIVVIVMTLIAYRNLRKTSR